MGNDFEPVDAERSGQAGTLCSSSKLKAPGTDEAAGQAGVDKEQQTAPEAKETLQQNRQSSNWSSRKVPRAPGTPG